MFTHTKFKSQVLLSDFALSLAIFIVIVSMIFFINTSLVRESETYSKIYDVEYTLNNIEHVFLVYTGNPQNWNISNVKIIGFSTGNENILNYTKLMYLSSLPYEKAKNYLSLNENYDFFVNITNPRDNKEIFSYGLYPMNGENIFKDERYAIINETLVKVSFYVWEK